MDELQDTVLLGLLFHPRHQEEGQGMVNCETLSFGPSVSF